MIPDPLLQHLAEVVPWSAASSIDKAVDLVRAILDRLEQQGFRLVEPAPLDVSPAALLYSCLAQIREALQRLLLAVEKRVSTSAEEICEDKRVILETLDEAELTATQLLSWLQHNIDLGARVPVAWAKWIADGMS